MRTTFAPLIVVLLAGACSANEMPTAPEATGGRPEVYRDPAWTNCQGSMEDAMRRTGQMMPHSRGRSSYGQQRSTQRKPP